MYESCFVSLCHYLFSNSFCVHCTNTCTLKNGRYKHWTDITLCRAKTCSKLIVNQKKIKHINLESVLFSYFLSLFNVLNSTNSPLCTIFFGLSINLHIFMKWTRNILTPTIYNIHILQKEILKIILQEVFFLTFNIYCMFAII